MKSRNLLAMLTGTVLLGAMALPAGAYSPASFNGPPDSTLFTTYTFSGDFANVYLSVCGHTAGSSGCYGGAQLGPFGHAGAIIEGNETVNLKTQTVTRNIYVVDQSVAGGTGTKLYIYTKTDVVGPTYDFVSVALTNTVTLPLAGGANVRTSLAANATNMYIGTNQTPFAVAVNKSTLAVTQIGGFSPPINVSSISANKYGYVTVTFGGISGPSGFYLYGPNGALQEDGGGADMMVNTMTGTTTLNLPVTAAPRIRDQVRFNTNKTK